MAANERLCRLPDKFLIHISKVVSSNPIKVLLNISTNSFPSLKQWIELVLSVFSKERKHKMLQNVTQRWGTRKEK